MSLAQEAKELHRALSAALDTLDASVQRAEIIRDPMTRHLLHCQQLLYLFDVMRFTVTGPLRITGSESEQQRVEQLFARLEEKNRALIEWIQQPTYGPDHPVGQTLMADSREHFQRQSIGDREVDDIKQ